MKWKDALVAVQSIPGTFWGVIFGSLFSLTGVWLTNRAADRRLQVQLANDRALRNAERELALRKEIYLAAIEAIDAAIGVIRGLADLDISVENIEKVYREKASAISKLHIAAP